MECKNIQKILKVKEVQLIYIPSYFDFLDKATGHWVFMNYKLAGDKLIKLEHIIDSLENSLHMLDEYWLSLWNCRERNIDLVSGIAVWGILTWSMESP